MRGFRGGPQAVSGKSQRPSLLLKVWKTRWIFLCSFSYLSALPIKGPREHLKNNVAAARHEVEQLTGLHLTHTDQKLTDLRNFSKKIVLERIGLW